MQLDSCGLRTVRPLRRPLCKRAATRPRGVVSHDLPIHTYFNTLWLMFTGRTLEQDDCTKRHKIPMQCLPGVGARRIQLTQGR